MYSRPAVSWKLEKNTSEKKGTVVSSCWLEGKAQNTTHIIDTTTNKMSRATLPSSGFAPSLSMGGALAPPNHGAAAPQRHVQAATRQGCTCCCWFACLGRRNKRQRITERGGCLGFRWPPFYQNKQQSNGRQCRHERVCWRRGKARLERVGRMFASLLGWDINQQKK